MIYELVTIFSEVISDFCLNCVAVICSNSCVLGWGINMESCRILKTLTLCRALVPHGLSHQLSSHSIYTQELVLQNLIHLATIRVFHNCSFSNTGQVITIQRNATALRLNCGATSVFVVNVVGTVRRIVVSVPFVCPCSHFINHDYLI
jgi:hypothetical protein